MENENNGQTEIANKMLYLLQKEILTFEEACIYLGRSASFMYKLTSGRLIPYYVPNGKLIYFKKTELDEWVLHNKRCSIEEIEHEGKRYLMQTKPKRNRS